jgi:diaminopimelate epimerase
VHSSELDGPLTPERVRSLCDRRFGIGADGILVVGPPTGHRWPLEIHNADGSLAESCGNGSRCVARHVMDRRGIDECELATAGGIVRAWRQGGAIGIALAAPRVLGTVSADGREGVRVDVGNPHIVAFVDEPARADLGALARAFRAVAGDANVEAAVVRGRGEIALRVDERGAGETLACGTGACAAVAAAAARGLVDREVSVTLPGGTLVVRAGPERYELWGPAERVFEGTV